MTTNQTTSQTANYSIYNLGGYNSGELIANVLCTPKTINLFGRQVTVYNKKSEQIWVESIQKWVPFYSSIELSDAGYHHYTTNFYDEDCSYYWAGLALCKM